MPKTVIIADDHPLTASGLDAMLGSRAGLSVVGTAGNGIDAIALIKRHRPDCAVLDLSMPGASGLEVFLEARRWSPETRFAIVTGISASSLFRQLYDAGVDGLFVKNASAEELQDGIYRIAHGQRVISKAAQDILDAAEDGAALTDREMQVLQCLAKGQSNKDIAGVLGISPKTVDTHRTALLRKMGANSTAALLVTAMRKGLLDV